MARKKTGVLGKINPKGSAKQGVVSPFIKWTGITLLVLLFAYFSIMTVTNLKTIAPPVESDSASEAQ